MERAGLHYFEQSSHIVENKGMDKDMDTVSRNDLKDAANTETELVVEIDESAFEAAGVDLNLNYPVFH